MGWYFCVCDLVEVVVGWRCINVVRVVMVFGAGWWRWVRDSSNGDWVMVYVALVVVAGW